jgi:hypothetical protein
LTPPVWKEAFSFTCLSSKSGNHFWEGEHASDWIKLPFTGMNAKMEGSGDARPLRFLLQANLGN